MASEKTGDRSPSERLEEFLGDPTRDLEAWQWLWGGDHEFPARSERGAVGRLVVGIKRLLRPFVKGPTADLWDRQRIFNLILLEHLRSHADEIARLDDLDRRLHELTQRFDARIVEQDERDEASAQRTAKLEEATAKQGSDAHELVVRLDARALEQDGRDAALEERASFLEDHNRLQDDRLESQYEENDTRVGKVEHRARHLESFLKEGLEELMRYSDALYSRVDQKLERFRSQSAELDHQLTAALAAVEAGETSALSTAAEERGYRELEAQYRGTQEEIADRAEAYVADLEGRERVLDLGCGRGEALAVLAGHGIGARGIDASSDMVRMCREQGLQAEEGDVMETLATLEPDSVDGVVSFHVIEHLPATLTARLVALAWRVLEPGGILILETPNPLSIAVAASTFWRDPTHLRPIHPDALRLSYEIAGFEKIERRLLRPFGVEERLPEISLDSLEGGARELAHDINLLRDRLDEAIFGHQDYALIGFKPES